MALSGLDIFKKLPKTNCKDCGFPTCLAFAMQLAAGKVELEKCPHVSAQAKEELAEASQPPILKVEVGAGGNSFKIGEETVMYRHDRTFVNQNAFAVTVNDSDDTAVIEEILNTVNNLKYDRVGQVLEIDAVCIKNKSNNRDTFISVVSKVASLTKKPLIFVSSDIEALKFLSNQYKDRRPLICGADITNVDAFISMVKETGCPVSVRGKTFDDIAAVTEKMRNEGIKNLIIDIGDRKFKDDFSNQVILRRAAIKKKDRLFGYPTIVFAD